jgi:Domain of unknown function (DUF4184)
MPFTLAHVAAALPLRRRPFVWSAVIVGTTAPDLEYFVRLAPNDGYGHTLAGSLLLSLPLAIATLWLFHSFVRAPLIEFLPAEVQRRMINRYDEFQFGGAGRFIWIVASILLGMMTHLIWDSFTHANTRLYRGWPALGESVAVPIVGPMPIYKVLQHGSTIIGLGALAFWLLLWYRNAPLSSLSEVHGEISPVRKRLFFAFLVATASLGAGMRAVMVIGIPSNHLAVKRFVGVFVVTSIAIIWWELVLYGLTRNGKWAGTADPSLRSG